MRLCRAWSLRRLPSRAERGYRSVMKVLVAEDDQDQLFVRGMLLRQSGFEAIEASDTRSALEKAVTHKPRCAVIDLNFPTQEAGLTLIRELKRLDPAMHIFVLTGTESGKLAAKPERGLIDEIIVKGSASPYLLERLKALAGKPS